MTALPSSSTRPDPWRVLRLLLVLAVVLLLTSLVISPESTWGKIPLPEPALLPLLLAVGSAFAALASAAACRSFRGTTATLFFAFTIAAWMSALAMAAVDKWAPSRWFLRPLVVEPLFAHWATFTTGMTLVLFLLLSRRDEAAGPLPRGFSVELLPLSVWALESSANLIWLFDGHYSGELVFLWWFAEGMIAQMTALAATILFVAAISRLHLGPSGRRGLLPVLVAVATVMIDRALTLAVLVSWAADSGAG